MSSLSFFIFILFTRFLSTSLVQTAVAFDTTPHARGLKKIMLIRSRLTQVARVHKYYVYAMICFLFFGLRYLYYSKSLSSFCWSTKFYQLYREKGRRRGCCVSTRFMMTIISLQQLYLY